MKTFQYTCLHIDDVCNHNDLDYNSVMDMIAASDVSFGNNDDTLITVKTFREILGDEGYDTLDFDKHDDDNVMISLGS
jgi:hypothetical protein